MTAPRKRLLARKLDYRRRLRMLKGANRRVVVRLTHNHCLMQYVETEHDPRGLLVNDRVKFTCSTYGKPYGNNQATVRQLARQFKARLPPEQWIFDFGLVSPGRRAKYRAVIEELQ